MLHEEGFGVKVLIFKLVLFVPHFLKLVFAALKTQPGKRVLYSQSNSKLPCLAHTQLFNH